MSILESKVKAFRIDIMNRNFMPHILALLLHLLFGRQSLRILNRFSIIFEDLPRTGIPEVFLPTKELNMIVM